MPRSASEQRNLWDLDSTARIRRDQRSRSIPPPRKISTSEETPVDTNPPPQLASDIAAPAPKLQYSCSNRRKMNLPSLLWDSVCKHSSPVCVLSGFEKLLKRDLPSGRPVTTHEQRSRCRRPSWNGKGHALPDSGCSRAVCPARRERPPVE